MPTPHPRAGLLLPLALSVTVHVALCAPIESFSTGGHTVYHLRPASVKGGRAVIAAAWDGAVLCYTPRGKLLWKANAGAEMPYDLAVADIDKDGLDEILVATAGGALYAIGHDGRPLWTFRRTAPLFQVTAARGPGGVMRILTGGVEQVLYSLSPDGKLLGSMKTGHCIRHLRAGAILNDGRDYAALATTNAGLSGRLSLLLVDPETLKPLWTQTNLGTFAANSGRRFFSMLLLDLNRDGRQDILLSNSWGQHGMIYAFDGAGKALYTASDERIPNVSYRMNLLSHIKLPGDEYVAGLFANILILYELDGRLRKTLTSRYDFTNAAFDPQNATYYLGSSSSGGDGIYALHLGQPGWETAFEKLQPVGKLAQIERNIAQLKERIAAFKAPSYQPAPRPATVLARSPPDRNYRHLRFVEQMSLSQSFENCKEVWCRDTDRRQRYRLSADEIVAIARERESKGRDFLIWSGHGHAVYMPVSTMERVLKAAPKHFYGFVFAEMEGVDREMQEVVEQIILPLAELCRTHGGKKIVFRNKNIFYNGAAYVPFWRKVLMDERFRDVLVPALEETNSRTPELSLAGRIGLWMTGAFERWACRAVTDNACWDRMWEWSSQQVQSHHLRQLIANASLGASVFFNNVHQGPFTAELETQFVPFYDMLEKGIIHVPLRNELLSLSPLSLGMKSPPSPLYLSHGINGHSYRYPLDDHSPLVFDRLDSYWGGAPVLPHDFSYYAMNLRRRVANFLPPLPYGMVAMIPNDIPLAGSRFTSRISTDGQYFYDASGARRSPAEYKPVVEQALQRAAAGLPVLVKGGVHWSAARLDASHVRVTLVDSGYFDPADRDAEIVIQQGEAAACTDILSGERILVRGGRVALRVPMGIARIVDISFR